MKSLMLILSTSSSSSAFAASSSLGILGARMGGLSGDFIRFFKSPDALAEPGFVSSPFPLPSLLLYSETCGFSKSRDLSKTGSLVSS